MSQLTENQTLWGHVGLRAGVTEQGCTDGQTAGARSGGGTSRDLAGRRKWIGLGYAALLAVLAAGCERAAPASSPDPIALAWAALDMEPESAPRVHWIEGCASSVPEDSWGENRTGLSDAAGCVVFDIGVDGWLEVRAADRPSDSSLVKAMVGWRSWLLTTNFVNDPDPDGAARATAALVAAGL